MTNYDPIWTGIDIALIVIATILIVAFLAINLFPKRNSRNANVNNDSVQNHCCQHNGKYQ